MSSLQRPDAYARAHVDEFVDQNAGSVFNAFERHVEARAPGHVVFKAERLASRNPDRTPLDPPLVQSLVHVMQNTWSADLVVHPTAGPSGPTDLFVDLGLPVVATGYFNPELKQHSRPDNMTVASFERGIRASVFVPANVGATDPR
jgi:acetylornithine deacetylase/succinyl-diaminopimelate desuccinylase-like protein